MVVRNWLSGLFVRLQRQRLKNVSARKRRVQHRQAASIVETLEQRQMLTVTISNMETTTGVFYVGAAPIQLTAAETLSQTGSSAIQNATIKIDANYVSTEDVLTYNSSATPSISGSWNSTTGTLTLSGTDTLADYQTALRNVYYQDQNANSPSTSIRRFAFTVTDSVTGATVDRYFNIGDNVQINGSTSVNYTVGQTPTGDTATSIAPSLTLASSASGNLSEASVEVSANYVQGEDVLVYPSQIGSITGTFNASTGILTLSGTDTVAHYQSALRSISYEDTSLTPSNSTRKFDFWTGTSSAPLSAFVSNGIGEVYFSMQLHWATISNLETTTALFVDSSSPLQLTSALTLSDSNGSSTSVSSARVVIDANYVATSGGSPEDVLSFNNSATPSITGTWNSTTGTLTLSGTDTLADYQTALRSVYYQDENVNSPNSAIRRFAFTLFDGSVVSGTADRYVNIDDNVQNLETTTYTFGAGSAPTPITNTLTLAASASGNLSGAAVQINANYLSTEDVLAYPAQIGNITGSFNASTGVLTLSGSDTVAHYQAALRSITYTDTNAHPSTNIRRFSFWTGTASAPSSRFLSVGEGERYFNVDAPPTVATAASATPSPVTGTTTALSVLGADYQGESVLTYTWATTGTPPAAVTFSANGTNAAKNTTATFAAAGTYSFQVTISDGLVSTTSSVTVTVSQTLTTITVTPSSPTVNETLTQQFTAVAYDQFGRSLTTQPTFTWSETGIGSLGSSGLYTAPNSTGTANVTATSGSVSGTSAVTVSDPAPTVSTAASATPTPVTGTTSALNVLGADYKGESVLTYTWATTGTPPAAVTFSANGTNAAKNTTATFTKAGTYSFQVTISDGQVSTTSSVTVTVNQTLTTINVAPTSATVNETLTQQFTAVREHQRAVHRA